MIDLNLPKIACNIRKNDGKFEVFDIIRKKYVRLTPEEWVRQHLVHFLIHDKKYPRALIRIESGLKYNTQQKRSDILVYDREARPFLIIECKSFEVKINQSVVDQVSVYNKQLAARFAVVSNGLVHYCFQYDPETGSVNTIDIFPDFF